MKYLVFEIGLRLEQIVSIWIKKIIIINGKTTLFLENQVYTTTNEKPLLTYYSKIKCTVTVHTQN